MIWNLAPECVIGAITVAIAVITLRILRCLVSLWRIVVSVERRAPRCGEHTVGADRAAESDHS
jgi:hypothetical protein